MIHNLKLQRGKKYLLQKRDCILLFLQHRIHWMSNWFWKDGKWDRNNRTLSFSFVDPFISLFNIYQNMLYKHHVENNSHCWTPLGHKYSIAKKSDNLVICIMQGLLIFYCKLDKMFNLCFQTLWSYCRIVKNDNSNKEHPSLDLLSLQDIDDRTGHEFNEFN